MNSVKKITNILDKENNGEFEQSSISSFVSENVSSASSSAQKRYEKEKKERAELINIQ